MVTKLLKSPGNILLNSYRHQQPFRNWRVSNACSFNGDATWQTASQIKEHMDVISSDKKTVGKVDHLEGPDKIKLTRQSSPDGQHHHFIPLDWVDHVDQHVHLKVNQVRT